MSLLSTDQQSAQARVSKIAPAPWTLHGDGHIILCHGSRSQNLSDAAIPTPLRHSYQNLFNMMMFVNYKHSPVGPYRELLYIPGRFRFSDQKFHASITKIYVDSLDSTWNGRQNWGIPKEMADFDLTTTADGSERISLSQKGQSFASFTLRPRGPQLPINLNWLPAWTRTFAEILDHKCFRYTFNGKGHLQFARFQADHFDSRLFPDLNKRRCLLAFKVNNFTLKFPVSTMLRLSQESESSLER